MTRQLCLLALFGLALIPDWAAAFGPHRPYCGPPPVVFVVPCQPVVVPPPAARLHPPTVTAEPAKADAPKAEPSPKPPGVPMSLGNPPPDPAPVRPAAVTIPEPPAPAPEPRPAPPLKLKPVEDPAGGAKPAAPLVVPQVPAPSAKGPDEKLPTIPKLTPSLPGGADGLPPLAMPPQGEAGKSTSKSSPLSGAPRPVVDVVPVDGPPPTDPTARRKVGFFNLTDRDLKLTVEGETITLPRRHYVPAEVPAKFTWKMDGGAEQTTEVPAAAPGVEVVIRK